MVKQSLNLNATVQTCCDLNRVNESECAWLSLPLIPPPELISTIWLIYFSFQFRLIPHSAGLQGDRKQGNDLGI